MGLDGLFPLMNEALQVAYPVLRFQIQILPLRSHDSVGLIYIFLGKSFLQKARLAAYLLMINHQFLFAFIGKIQEESLLLRNQRHHVPVDEIADAFQILYDGNHAVYLIDLITRGVPAADPDQIVLYIFLQVVDFRLPHIQAFHQRQLGEELIPLGHLFEEQHPFILFKRCFPSYLILIGYEGDNDRP